MLENCQLSGFPLAKCFHGDILRAACEAFFKKHSYNSLILNTYISDVLNFLRLPNKLINLNVLSHLRFVLVIGLEKIKKKKSHLLSFKGGTSSHTVSESQIQDLSLFCFFVYFAFVVVVDYVLLRQGLTV